MAFLLMARATLVSEDTPARFEAYGWHVIRGVDGHDATAIKTAIDSARAQTDKPTLICCRTIIGFGSPNKQGKESSHGAALGDKEVALARETLQWPYPPFVIPEDVKAAWDARARGQAREQQWQSLYQGYAQAHPALAAELARREAKQLPSHWQAHMATLLKQTDEAAQSIATRKASQLVLENIGAELPELLGGSADLTDSNLTAWKGSVPIRHDHPQGNYLHYGVREFGMGAIMNGIALYGAFIPYGGTFLTFLDYARNAVRMAAIMKIT